MEQPEDNAYDRDDRYEPELALRGLALVPGSEVTALLDLIFEYFMLGRCLSPRYIGLGLVVHGLPELIHRREPGVHGLIIFSNL